MIDHSHGSSAVVLTVRPLWRAAARMAVVSAMLIVVLASCGGGKDASPQTGAQPGGQASAQAGGKPQGGGSGGGGPGGGQYRRGFAAIPVQSVKASFGALTADRAVSGSVVPVTQSNVAAQTAGVVATVVHQAGDWVNSGDTVIQLDDSQLKLAYQTALGNLKNAQINLQVGQQNTNDNTPTLQLQLKAAQAALSSAQKNYDALEAASKIGGVAETDLDSAQAQLQQAQANYSSAQNALSQNQNANTQSIAQLQVAVETAQNSVDQAKLNLSYAAIKAPFSGQIASVNVTPGEYVSQNTPAYVLVSSQREVSFNVPPTDATSLTIGRAVTFNSGGDSYKGHINQTPSAPINGVVPLTAALDGGGNLPFGAIGNVTYSINLGQGVIVPIGALQNDGNENYVFSVVQGKAHIQPITILSETGSEAALGQIDSGSEVILNPPPGLLDGAAVTPVAATGQGGGQGGTAAAGATGARGASGGGSGNQGGSGSAAQGGGASGSRTASSGSSSGR